MGVLDLNRCIVDQYSDGKRQPAERHDVEGLAEEAENNDRGEDREWDRDHHDQRGAPTPEEKQDHQAGQTCGDDGLPHDTVDRGPHKQRLIKKKIKFERRR